MSDNSRILGSVTVDLKDGNKMTLNYNYCKRCGICVAFCPKSVYDLNPIGQPIPTKPEQCTICMQCVLRCPDFVIEIEKHNDQEQTKSTSESKEGK